MRFFMGFRVRRRFMFMKRDDILYQCPFCHSELVIPLGYTDSKGMWINPMSRMAKAIPAIPITKSALERELEITKKACKGIWPPNG